MRRTTLSLTVLFLALSLLQISTPYGFATLMPGYYTPVTSAAPAEPISLDTLTRLSLNSSQSSKAYSLTLSSPAQMSFNSSLIVDSGSAAPFSGPSFNIYLRGSYAQYFPHLNQHIDGTNSFWSDSWWWMTTGQSDTSYTEFLTIQPGRLIVDFRLGIDDSTDQVSVNFTLSQLFDFSSTSTYTWDQPILTTWSTDNSWSASTYNLPESGLYNISYFSEINYVTTASWGGNPFFQPFIGIELIDGTYGENAVWDNFNPVYNIPSGAGSGTANWTDVALYTQLPDDYYLLGEVGAFEFLNGSSITFEMTIVPVDMTILDINQSIDLSFEDTPSGSVAYVGIRAPQMYTYGLYFDNHVGANWSLDCRDVFTGFLPPTYAYTEDASSYTLVETRLEDAFVFSMPMMASTPTTSIIGNQYIEMYQCGGTGVNYVNGSAIMASMSSGAYQNIIDTFYIQIVGSSFGGVQTSEFNVTFHFEAYQIPVLPLVTTSFSVNQTIGPFYQAYALPVISGHEYDLSVWASDYNTSGVAGIFMAPVPQIYLDWQWAGMVPLYQTTPSGGMPMQVININETAGLRFIAVRTTTLYVGMVGTSMSGPPPSDTTEVTFNVTVSLPTPYALGSVVTESLDDMDWAIYSTTVTAGTSYRLSLSLDASGNYVLGSVFDGLGYTPFDAMMYTLWSEVYTDYLNSSITYQALTSGPVTIILIGDGDVSFSLVAVGEAPGSFVLGLIIGLIFMIAGVIIVYVVMRRRY
jgi:hypothetical protein